MFVHPIALRFFDFWPTILAPTKHCHPECHPSLMLLFPQNLIISHPEPSSFDTFSTLAAWGRSSFARFVDAWETVQTPHKSSQHLVCAAASAHSALLPHFVLLCFLCAKLNMTASADICTYYYSLSPVHFSTLTSSLTLKPFASRLLSKKDTIQEIRESFRNRNPVCSPKEIENNPGRAKTAQIIEALRGSN